MKRTSQRGPSGGIKRAKHDYLIKDVHTPFLTSTRAECNVRFQRVTVISHFPKISTRNTSPAPSGAEKKAPAENIPPLPSNHELSHPRGVTAYYPSTSPRTAIPLIPPKRTDSRITSNIHFPHLFKSEPCTNTF